MLRVLVLVDSEDASRRRTCFWEALLAQISDTHVELRSLPEARGHAGGPKFIDFNRFDVIVFNWDVLNGDLWFQGEITAGMVGRAARPAGFLPEWVRRGGLILIEAQCRHWAPSQEAYQVVLPDPGFVVSRHAYYEATPGSAFVVSRSYSDHPFARGLDDPRNRVYQGGDNSSVPWFPDWLKHDAVRFNYSPTRPHSGGFATVSADWLPILRCQFSGLPILVCRVAGKGAVVASTMYMASSGQRTLI
jgi:hypothetical protein